MSLYALTAAGLQRIKRKWFGVKVPSEFQQSENGTFVPVEGGQQSDTGVQEAVNELVAGLSAQQPVQLTGAFQLVQDGNAPAIQLFRDGIGDGPIIQVVDYINNQITNVMSNGVIQNITNAFNSTSNNLQNVNVNNTTNTNNSIYQTNVNQVVNNLTVDGMTGSQQVLVGATVSVSGCTVTINGTYVTFVMQNGLVKSVS